MASYEKARSLLKNSVSRPTLYSLTIDSPLINTEARNYLKLFVNRVNLPGLVYEEIDTMGQEHMGIIQTLPGGIMYGTANRFTFEVIESSDFTAYNALRALFNSKTAMGANPLENDRTQRMRYYEDYIFNVQLMKLEFPNNQDENVSRDDGNHMIDAGYKKVANYKFERCHMTEITAMDFNSANFDGLLTYGCTIAFESYHWDNQNSIYPGRND